MLKFDGDLSFLQQRMASSSAGFARRQAMMSALNIQAGYSVLDIGCGGGHLVEELAMAVGPDGYVFGLDPSDTQILSAKKRCRDLDNTTFFCCLADEIDLPKASCDAITSTQTLEYIQNVDDALSAIVPLQKPRSKFANVSILWDHFKFHGAEQAVNDIIHDAFKAHCFHQMLPMELPGKLTKLGYKNIKTTSLAFVITNRHENSPAKYAETVMATFALSQGISEDIVIKWKEQLHQAELNGSFGFTSFPVLTEGVLS